MTERNLVLTHEGLGKFEKRMAALEKVMDECRFPGQATAPGFNTFAF